MEVDLLKQLTWQYVILNPSMAAQQFGQRKIVSDLFGIFADAAIASETSPTRRVLPRGVGDTLAKMEQDSSAADVSVVQRLRIAADAVAGLTEQQALALHKRLTGHDSTSVFDPIVR
jgi:dGTPase